MVRRNRLIFILPIIAVSLFVGWFLFMSYDASKANEIERKVIAALNSAIDIQQRNGERVQITDKSAGKTFFAPYFGHPEQQSEVLENVLYFLNTDESVPPLKLSRFHMFPFNSTGAQVTVTYIGAFGMKKSVEINTTVKQIHYKYKTGPETYN